MPKTASGAAGAVAALLLLAGLAFCVDGSGNSRFTHPYTGAEGSNSATGTPTPEPSSGGLPASNGGNGSLLQGATQGAGTIEYTGNVAGLTFTPTVVLFDATGPDPNTPQSLTLVLASDTNFCSAFTAQGNLMLNSNYAIIQVQALDSNLAATTLGPGNYNVVTTDVARQSTAGNYASFNFGSFYKTCTQLLNPAFTQGQSGNLSLTTLATNPNTPAATGNMGVVLGQQQDALSFTFEAAPCPGLNEITQDPNSFGCE